MKFLQDSINALGLGVMVAIICCFILIGACIAIFIYGISVSYDKEIKIKSMDCKTLQSYYIGKQSIYEWTDSENYLSLIKDQYVGRCLT